MSPVGAALPRRKTNARVIVPLLRSSILLFVRVYPGFHIGLCPHFTLGFAGVSPFQGSLSDWLHVPRVSYRALPSFHLGLCRSAALAGIFVVLGICGVVVVLCSLNVFGECKWIVAFVRVFVFDCGCIVCGIDCCVRAMSPKGAILPQSPGRKPWVRYVKTYFEPR